MLQSPEFLSDSEINVWARKTNKAKQIVDDNICKYEYIVAHLQLALKSPEPPLEPHMEHHTSGIVATVSY